VDKRDKTMGRRMLAIYRETDREVEEKAAKLGSRCSKGCASCCHLLVSVTFPEAVAVAEHVLSWPSSYAVTQLVARLNAQVQVVAKGMADKDPELYFRSKLPCVFLDQGTQACTIYAQRPSACRLHHVVTDPALCSPEAEAATVGRVDFQDVGLRHVNEAAQASSRASSPLWSGPFQVMLLWALKMLREGRTAVELAHTAKLGPLSLHLWRVRGEVPVDPAPAGEQPLTI
jgi:Fe-S-cluster containining protein